MPNARMLNGRNLLGVLLAAIIASPVMLPAAPAGAAITEDKRYTFDTAYGLKKGEVLIGLGYLQVGVHDRLDIGTVFLADLLGIYNVIGKINLYKNENLRLSLQTGILYFNSDYSVLKFLLPEGTNISMTVVPIGPLLSMKTTPGQYLHLSASYAFAAIKATGSDGSTLVAAGSLGLTGGHAMYEIDTQSGNAILLGAGAVYADKVFPDAFAAYVFGWETFHLELGGGVGPRAKTTTDTAGVSTTTTAAGFVPRINLWWRF